EVLLDDAVRGDPGYAAAGLWMIPMPRAEVSVDELGKTPRPAELAGRYGRFAALADGLGRGVDLNGGLCLLHSRKGRLSTGLSHLCGRLVGGPTALNSVNGGDLDPEDRIPRGQLA